jgi:hypothetical protein
MGMSEISKKRPYRSELENWYGPNTYLVLVCGKILSNKPLSLCPAFLRPGTSRGT